MSGNFVGRRVASVSKPPAFEPISQVVVKVDANNAYIAGDGTGRTLEITCPYGTQTMADNLLTELGGYIYNPVTAADALIDQAAELGDPITVDGVYTVLAKMRTSFGTLTTAEISAPGQEEIESEYPHLTNEEKVQYQLAATRSYITKTAEQIRLEVANDLDGLSSSFTVELDSISAEVVGAQNAISSLELEVDSITSRVQDAEGNISILEQTVNGFDARVEDVESGLSQTVSMTADGILISNEDGSELEIDGGQLKAQTVIAYRLQADTILLKTSDGTTVGRMYLSDASTADYKLDINAEAVAITTTESGGALFLGNADGAFLQIIGTRVYCNANYRPSVDDSYSLGGSSYRWSDIYAANDVIQTSDRHRKKNIAYGLSRYDSFFDGLKPSAYRMTNGQRIHTGLVAQDIEQLLIDCGIDTMDFAGFVKTPREDGTGYDYGLRYSEFIPLLIEQVQGLKTRLTNVEARYGQKQSA